MSAVCAGGDEYRIQMGELCPAPTMFCTIISAVKPGTRHRVSSKHELTNHTTLNNS